ncbi:MAG: NTP transferase domain-containing protein [Micromonosporaceae bacterium]|nr:NTP transferase domain-containing protein [Micromonosporaceae bacterium]
MVLAAGEGKRMRSRLPKVLHPILGRSMLGHVLSAVERALPHASTLVVVGRGAQQVEGHVAAVAPAASTVLQAEQRGTGHAVRIALQDVPERSGTVVVLNGDIPLLREETLRALVEGHQREGRAATVLTAEVDNPYGLGRVLRDENGQVTGIVEERDATASQRMIREINAGAYVFDAAALRTGLGKLSTDNDQGEEYLTDVFGLLIAEGARAGAHLAATPTETLGANDRAELATLRALMRDRINEAWMRSGVSIVDPATAWIDVAVVLEPDAVIEPNTHLRGHTSIASGAVVGPDTTIIDGVVGAGATVVRAHVVESVIEAGRQVGPFAHLRPEPAAGGVGRESLAGPSSGAGGVADPSLAGPGVRAADASRNDGSGPADVPTEGGPQ